ncbi:hypothetical protein CBW54_09645 [Yersinia kristensenii]|nr:hypothetical protein CBW54_09645 [Yersinia kristensenii]
MLKFTAKSLKPVLAESHRHHGGLLLVKNEGVYVMANKDEQKGGPIVAYAVGLGPADLPDRWALHRASAAACGGDDFVEFLSLPPFIMSTLMEGYHDLIITMNKRSMSVDLWPSKDVA